MSGYNRPILRAAAVQASSVYRDAPVYLDVRATLDKSVGLIKEAAKNGARLVVFPETFLPSFPYWSIDVGNPHEWTMLWREYVNNSVEVPGPEAEVLCQAAKQADAYVVMGINERDKSYGGRMYNSALYISPSEGIMGVHRKLHPTLGELLHHTRGDGGDNIKTYMTEIGTLGSLICGEHIQLPLIYSMIASGEEINCSLWPGTRKWGPKGKEGYSLETEIQVMTRAACIAGAMFAVSASACIPEDQRPKKFVANTAFNREGGSSIIDPTGEYVTEPVYGIETIVYGDIDFGRIAISKAVHNILGAYSRFDIFSLAVRRQGYSPLIPMEQSTPSGQEDIDRIGELEERIRTLEAQLRAVSTKKTEKK